MITMTKAWLAVDPGLKGYLCLLVPDLKIVEFKPNTEQPRTISAWLKDIDSKYELVITVIEDVHSIFGTSAKSNFNFGFNTGLITGIIQANSLPLAKIQPKKWQKAIGCKTSGKELKKEVAQIASNIYPYVLLYGSRGGLLDGKSDALMIAHYAYLTYR